MESKEINYFDLLKRLLDALESADISFAPETTSESASQFEEIRREAQEAVSGYTESEA